MVSEPFSQQIDKRWIFVFLQDHLVEQFLSEDFLLFSRQRENFWQRFDNHGKKVTDARSKLQTLLPR